MQESATTKTIEKIYWSYLESKDVYTNDGRKVGILRGIMVDPTTWTIPQFIIEVDKDILEELNIMKPLLSVALVNVPTSYVKSLSDVVQLNADLAAMKGSVDLYFQK